MHCCRWLRTIDLDRVVLDGDADKVSSARHSKLGFELAAVIRSGFIAYTRGVSDLSKAAALREEMQNLEIASGKVA